MRWSIFHQWIFSNLANPVAHCYNPLHETFSESPLGKRITNPFDMREILKRFAPEFLKWCYRNREDISRLAGTAKKLTKETGICYLALLFDMSVSLLRYPVIPREYRMFRFYERKHWSRKQFLTDYRSHKIWKSFVPDHEKYAPMSIDKQVVYRYFSDFLHRQWLFVPDVSDKQIEDFLCEQKQIIVKSRYHWYGTGIYKLFYSDVADMQALCQSLRNEEAILEEIIQQHPDLNSINPSSINSLRINTVLDKKDIPHVLLANLRMGSGETIIDNFENGGLSAGIDLDTGLILTPGIKEDLTIHIKHPTSGVILPGFQIPHWETTKEMVLRLARMAPQMRWAGWDVAITGKGPLLIEGQQSSAGAVVSQLPTQTGIYHILRSYL